MRKTNSMKHLGGAEPRPDRSRVLCNRGAHACHGHFHEISARASEGRAFRRQLFSAGSVASISKQKPLPKPGDSNMPSAMTETLCRRCGTSPATIVIRAEPLCRLVWLSNSALRCVLIKHRECFHSYVQTKTVKRLDAFRVRNATPGSSRKVLLPLSLGASSVSLLQLVDQQIERQLSKTGRAGFCLLVLHIARGPETVAEEASRLFAEVKSRYPKHEYLLLPEQAAPSASNLDAVEGRFITPSPQQMADLPASSQVDMSSVQRLQRTVDVAHENGCEAILWGDTTTRLAEKVLSETAKGRGASLSWLLNDGKTPYGLNFLFPLRELMKKEISAYAATTKPPLKDLTLSDPEGAVPSSSSSKNSTIDRLMSYYFGSVERDYPSIVANVVRTTAKLNTDTASETGPVCLACGTPLHGLRAPSSDSRLCYGCARSLHGSV